MFVPENKADVVVGERKNKCAAVEMSDINEHKGAII